VVFDEVHFGRMINAYTTTGEYFFELHPPLAKLLIAGAVKLGSYHGNQRFYAIHWPINHVSPALLRGVPALAGTLVPLLAFALLVQLGASDFAAMIGGLALALDNALLIETRILVVDGVLLAASLAALCCALAGLRDSSGRTAWMLAAGAFAGLAVGTKLTALAVVALIALCGISTWVRDRRWAVLRRLIGAAAAFAASALAVYAGGWWLHFALLTGPGSGDRWAPRTGDWIADTLRAHASMWSENTLLSAGHSYASAWWSWPLMMRAVLYWAEIGGSNLAFLGNPVVWWGSTLGLAAIFATGCWRAWTRRGPAWPPLLWIPLCGWGLSYLPLAAVPRVLFLYHYLTPLVFSVCAVVLWLDHSGRFTRPGDWRAQRPSVWALLAMLVLGFALISPFTLVYVKAPAYQEAVFALFPGWS
jgi:dolichyl-phosphate-mannose-protein mannosyltransferase